MFKNQICCVRGSAIPFNFCFAKIFAQCTNLVFIWSVRRVDSDNWNKLCLYIFRNQFFDCIFFNWDDPWLTTIIYNTGWQANFFNWRTLKNSILIKQYPPRWKWADDCQYNSMREKEIVFSFYKYSRLKQNSTCSLNKMSINIYLSSINFDHV